MTRRIFFEALWRLLIVGLACAMTVESGAEAALLWLAHDRWREYEQIAYAAGFAALALASGLAFVAWLIETAFDIASTAPPPSSASLGRS